MGAMPLLRNERVLRPTPARMENLAKLPVFWDLDGKRVIIAGGSDAAAWKAELLAACGAIVHVYSSHLSETFEDLIQQRPEHPQSRFVHHNRSWKTSDLKGACLAIADCETEDEAAVFRDAGYSAGVPVNIIDRPAFCQFQFGSIVNRSPVIVAISTDGAAPILAQAIRRRIEAVLPPALKAWATLAQSIRAKVNEQLAPGAARRAFWERFVDRAFASSPDSNATTSLLEGITGEGDDSTGSVTYVGAGPGNAELLTLKAVRALQAADAVFFDAAISVEMLELARREAKRIFVGKHSGDISGMMIALARDGKCVVHLKSGDPSGFDCPSQEIAQLKREGICVRIVPGVAAVWPHGARTGQWRESTFQMDLAHLDS